MLESILKKFRGVVLGLVVISLSAIFVLQFGGPQAEGCSGGGGAAYAAEVYGAKITVNEYRAAYALSGGENMPAELAKENKLEEMVLRGLVERALLARQAQRLGLHADPDEVMQKVAEDGIVHSSMGVDAGPYLPPSGPRRYDFKDTKGKFSKENLKRFVNYRLRRSVEEFATEQTEETLAQRMRETVMTAVTVSADEIWETFVREKESVTLEYARFSPAYYRERLSLAPAELDAFGVANAKDVDAEYEREKHRYTGLEKQVRAQHILIKVDASADEAQKAAARSRIDALLARIKKGEDFGALAREASEDGGTAKKGGDLGYNPKGRMVKPFDDAQFALAPGQVSGVVESSFGFHVIKVLGVREGDVPVAEAKRELLERLYHDRTAQALAKAAAEKTLAALRAGTARDAINAELAGLPPVDPAAGEPAPEADPLAPQLRESQPFGRTDTPIAGPFDAAPLVRAAFELTADAKLPGAPMQLGDEWVVYQLVSHVTVKRDDLTPEDAERIRFGLLSRKRREALAEYVRGLVRSAEAENAILVDLAALTARPLDNS